MNHQQATVDRPMAYEKSSHPGHAKQWHLEKTIYDLRRWAGIMGKN